MAARSRTPRTPKNSRARKPPAWPATFLAAFEDTHLVTEAAKQAKVHRQRAYELRDSDPVFAAAWAEIEERSTELLEREAYRRAGEGWRERGIFDEDGNEIGEVRKFSDTLMIFLLKARRPDTYRENVRHEHSGPEGGPIAAEITTVDAREASDAAHDFLARIAGPHA